VNLRLESPHLAQPKLEKQSSQLPLLVGHDDICNGPMIEFDPLDHTGYNYDDTQSQNNTQPADIKELKNIQVGSKISVYWPDDNAYYPREITSISQDGISKITDDDGDIEH